MAGQSPLLLLDLLAQILDWQQSSAQKHCQPSSQNDSLLACPGKCQKKGLSARTAAWFAWASQRSRHAYSTSASDTSQHTVVLFPS